MAKGVSAADYRKKNTKDLTEDLKKVRDELQQIRFTKVSGTAVAKLARIKILRKQVARILTILREKSKEDVIKRIRVRTIKEEKDGKEETKEITIKNLKFKHIPKDLRPKKTRAMRRRLTKFEKKLLTLKQFKRQLNFPKRKFAVPIQN